MIGIILKGLGVPVSIEDNSNQISPPKSMLTRKAHFLSSDTHFLWWENDRNYLENEGFWGASEHSGYFP